MLKALRFIGGGGGAGFFAREGGGGGIFLLPPGVVSTVDQLVVREGRLPIVAVGLSDLMLEKRSSRSWSTWSRCPAGRRANLLPVRRALGSVGTREIFAPPIEACSRFSLALSCVTVRLKLGLVDRSGTEGLGEGPRDDRAEPMVGPAMAPLDGGEYSSSSSSALWRPE